MFPQNHFRNGLCAQVLGVVQIIFQDLTTSVISPGKKLFMYVNIPCNVDRMMKMGFLITAHVISSTRYQHG